MVIASRTCDYTYLGVALVQLAGNVCETLLRGHTVRWQALWRPATHKRQRCSCNWLRVVYGL